MSKAIKDITPIEIWRNFDAINAIPRASKKEERIIQFMIDFGKKLGLKTMKDDIGNVVIKKPATPGMEDRKTIVLQSHLDMVHQKNADTEFDFDTEGIKMYIDGDWVKAEGTTLGADNGIGVATIMGILESSDYPHPPLEALFTIDEETGMTGAIELSPDLLQGKILLNLDTEDDNELTIGCAGGIDVTGRGTYREFSAPEGTQFFEIKLSGLTGGHSGADIHLGRANANKLMNRLLYDVINKFGVYIHSIDGGGLRNAIPRESKAIAGVSSESYQAVISYLEQIQKIFQSEYHFTDPDLEIAIDKLEGEFSVAEEEFMKKCIASIYTVPNGIYRMSPDIEGLVQTSNNLARVLLKSGQFEILCLCRSSVDTEKQDMVNVITEALKTANSTVTCSGAYPGWSPKPESEIVNIMTEVYQSLFNENPHVNAIHAGLECGIIGGHYPDMEMISFGPNIRGAHSPDERAQISSVEKFWRYFVAVLEQAPKGD